MLHVEWLLAYFKLHKSGNLTGMQIQEILNILNPVNRGLNNYRNQETPHSAEKSESRFRDSPPNLNQGTTVEQINVTAKQYWHLAVNIEHFKTYLYALDYER